VFVFVRRLSFVSDALTHTIFPGAVIGFLASRAPLSRSPPRRSCCSPCC
jgi:ABC-type Mn2+/Zn2+ transport system permease subunit